MTQTICVIPAEAGISASPCTGIGAGPFLPETPAFAGVTDW